MTTQSVEDLVSGGQLARKTKCPGTGIGISKMFVFAPTHTKMRARPRRERVGLIIVWVSRNIKHRKRKYTPTDGETTAAYISLCKSCFPVLSNLPCHLLPILLIASGCMIELILIELITFFLLFLGNHRLAWLIFKELYLRIMHKTIPRRLVYPNPRGLSPWITHTYLTKIKQRNVL